MRRWRVPGIANVIPSREREGATRGDERGESSPDFAVRPRVSWTKCCTIEPSLSWLPRPQCRPQSRWPTGSPGRCLRWSRLSPRSTFRDYGLGWDDYTHSQYGELLLALYASGFRDTRALSFVNLYLYGGGFDMAARLLAKILPFDLFETRRLAGAAVGLIGLFVDVADRPPRRRAARRPARADPARDLPALLRAHVHQREGRAVRGGDGGVSARPRAPARGISEALGRDARHRRAWASAFRSARASWRASA